MKKKIRRNRHITKYLLYSILCVLILVLTGGLFVLISFNLVPMTGNTTLNIVIAVLLLIVSTASLGAGIVTFVIYKQSSNAIRFDYATLN